MQVINEPSLCLCSNTQSQPANEKLDFPDRTPKKYFQEIGAEMLGNQLIIRVEKNKDKDKKKRNQWDPPCDCDMVEIRRPSGKEGPKIVNAGDNNQILFRINSKAHLNSKDDSMYKPQAIAYKIGPTKGGPEGSNNCRTITVHPQLGGPGTQEVFSEHITEGNQDIFLLRIKKKGETTNEEKRNIEVELRTPKPPPPPPQLPPPIAPTEPENPPVSKTDVEKGKKGKKEKGTKKKK